MIRFGRDFHKEWRMEDRNDRRPPDSLLQAFSSAISCCFISRFVDVIRRTNTVCCWQEGLRVIPTFESTQHIIYMQYTT